MKKEEELNTTTTTLINSTKIKEISKIYNHEFTNYEKSQAMGVVALGALIANIPIITLINWYGPRYIFTIVGLFGAFATALIPISMEMGFSWYKFLKTKKFFNQKVLKVSCYSCSSRYCFCWRYGHLWAFYYLLDVS